jgi:hypothetical protein
VLLVLTAGRIPRNGFHLAAKRTNNETNQEREQTIGATRMEGEEEELKNSRLKAAGKDSRIDNKLQ